MEALGSHINGIKKSLDALELGCQKDKDRVSCLEANQKEFSHWLDSLINLLFPQHSKGDAMRLNVGSDPSQADERESEVNNRGVWGQFSGRQAQEVSNDSPITAIKIQFPMFNGVDPLGWLARAKQYFHIHNTSETLKLQMALICMEGTALHWARWLEDQNPELTWTQFRKQLLHRYAGEMVKNSYKFLVAAKQSRSIAEYIREFETRATQIKGLTDELCLGLFLNGLHEDIRVQIF